MRMDQSSAVESPIDVKWVSGSVTVSPLLIEQLWLHRNDPIVEGLERSPAHSLAAYLFGGHARHLVLDEFPAAGSHGHELDLAAALERDEPPGSFVDGSADGEEPVVLQDRGL